MTPLDPVAMLWRRRGWRIGLVAGCIAVAITAAFGGFDKADAGTRAIAGAGHTVDAGALAITPLRAWRTRTPPGRTPDPGSTQDYLVLQVRVDNRTDTGFSAYTYTQSDIIWASAGSAERTPDSLLRSDDHSPYVAFPPRLPVSVDLVWKVPATSPPLSQATWSVYGRRFVEQTYLVRESAWLRDRPVAKLDLPVADLRTQGAMP